MIYTYSLSCDFLTMTCKQYLRNPCSGVYHHVKWLLQHSVLFVSRRASLGARLQIDALKNLFPNQEDKEMLSIVGDTTEMYMLTEEYMRKVNCHPQGKSAKLNSIAQKWPQNVYSVPKVQIIKVHYNTLI